MSGYLEKPCLNPHDEDCPDTAPNKNSNEVRYSNWDRFTRSHGATHPVRLVSLWHLINHTLLTSYPVCSDVQRLDIGAVVSGGCRGFAPRYMHWEEELIIGGVSKDKAGTVIEWVWRHRVIVTSSSDYDVSERVWRQGVSMSVMSSIGCDVILCMCCHFGDFNTLIMSPL